jgi:queuine tRNA-ribosyltransferase
VVEWTAPLLPADRPRYLMGVGYPEDIFHAVRHGVDLFDCVLPTRFGRHGTILTDAGRLNLRNAQWIVDDEPLDPGCPCRVCARWSRGYLRHLLMVGEPTASRLATLHNLAWTLRLVDRMRAAIETGRFATLRNEVLAAWG